MLAVTGITGQVGGAVGRRLLEIGQPVRAIMRDGRKAEAWRARGCEVGLADLSDATALSKALTGAAAVFIVIPPIFDPTAGFPEVRGLIDALRAALLSAGPSRIVCLSTIGAQVTRPNLLNQLSLVEEALSGLPIPVAFLRAAWFMENAAWDVAPAREGRIPSLLQPLDKPVPMVATADIGRVGAAMLLEDWVGRRIVELEGPARVTPIEIAAAFSRTLGRPVRTEMVPRETWDALFRSQGMQNPTPRAQMLDGFNEGWIAFEGTPDKGTTPIEAVIGQLVRGDEAGVG